MGIDQTLQTAVQHHHAGRLADAERGYRQILAAKPGHPDALHLLGVLAGQAGHLDHAIDLIGRATRVNPEFADAFANLGRVLADRGRLDEAVDSYRRVTELKPRDASAQFNLGVALRTAKRSDEAIAAFSRAAEMNPKMAEAFIELGNLVRAKGQLDEAVSIHKKAVELRPDSADAHISLANSLERKGDEAGAISEFNVALKLNPASPTAHFNLGNVLSKKHHLDEALRAFDSAIRLKPDYAEAYTNRGLLLAEMLRFEEAIQSHRRALELNPNHAKTHEGLGDAFYNSQQIPAAAESYRRALELDPVSVTGLAGLGIAQRAQGKFDEAIVLFRRILEVNPGDPKAYQSLASLVQEVSDAEIDRLTVLLKQEDLPTDERVSAGFAAGKLLDAADRFDEAFERYAEANRLHRAYCVAEGARFDPAELRRQVDGMIERFTPDFFRQRRDWGVESELPVFIVGMPRSGTTLVEQIAASHSRIHGAGELTDIGAYVYQLELDKAGAEQIGWNRESIGRIARAHLDRLKNLRGDAVRVIDKMPSNIMNLGLIACLFPNARVINCNRDPRDNCLSCYFQMFKKANLLFAYDLADCAAQYLQQTRLAEHWRKALPLRMLEINYEECVGDLEGQSRRLIDFLGLEWEPQCLEFYKTERPVLTASVWQVRQPIYKSSVGRWRHYESHLGPLLAALEQG
jgi:tetratricopeptide (TPR) repeat protein